MSPATDTEATATAATTSTKERLRRVAMECFAASGYGGTSMADIAGRVGVRKASLYNYYGSKEELLLDLFERALEAWKDACRPAMEGPGSHRERLWRHLAACLRFLDEHPHEVGVIRLAAFQIGGELGERVMDRFQRSDDRYCRRMGELFESAVAAGEIAPAETEDLVMAWKVFADGVLINEMFAPAGASPLRSRLPVLWEQWWRGLGGRSDEPLVVGAGADPGADPRADRGVRP